MFKKLRAKLAAADTDRPSIRHPCPTCHRRSHDLRCPEATPATPSDQED